MWIHGSALRAVASAAAAASAPAVCVLSCTWGAKRSPYTYVINTYSSSTSTSSISRSMDPCMMVRR